MQVSNGALPTHVSDQPAVYRITILGRLGVEWASTFGAMELRSETSENGESMTTLYGIVVDQSALYGLLNQIRDLGLILLTVERC